jgi:hypothetical protein
MTSVSLQTIESIRKLLRRSIPAGHGPSERVRAATKEVHTDDSATSLLPDLEQQDADDIDFVDELDLLFVKDDEFVGLLNVNIDQANDETITTNFIEEPFDLQLLSTYQSDPAFPEGAIVVDNETRNFRLKMYWACKGSVKKSFTPLKACLHTITIQQKMPQAIRLITSDT